MKNAWIVIPARRGSKGFPFKNRYLFEYSAKEIPKHLANKTVVTSDDEQILEEARHNGFRALKRKSELSGDAVSTKLVIKDVIDIFSIPPEDDIIITYLTYPQRTFSQITLAYDFYLENKSKSLLCKKKVKSHPYMCYLMRDGFKGEKIVSHDLFRRQDYPQCFEVCHYIVILKAGILDRLDKNFHYENTIFYPLDEEIADIDVDSMEDFESFKELI